MFTTFELSIEVLFDDYCILQ